MIYYLHYSGDEMLGLFPGSTKVKDVPKPFIRITEDQYNELLRNPSAYFLKDGEIHKVVKSEETLIKETIGRDVAQLRSEASVKIQELEYKGAKYRMDNNALLYVQSAILTEQGVSMWLEREGQWLFEEHSAKETRALLKAWVEHKTKVSAQLKGDRDALVELARENNAYS